jgi:hypothetical protein
VRRKGACKGVESGEGEMNRQESFHAGSNGMESDTRKATGEVLSYGSGKVD